jgi:hypothetical protein
MTQTLHDIAECVSVVSSRSEVRACRLRTNVANYSAVNLARISIFSPRFVGHVVSGTAGHFFGPIQHAPTEVYSVFPHLTLYILTDKVKPVDIMVS